MGKSSRKKVSGHSELQPGEQVVDACWGMGRTFLKAADIAGKSFVSKAISKKPGYAQELDAATAGEGLASSIDRNGMLVLTDQRLLFMAVKTAVTKPKSITAAFPLEVVEDVIYEKPILSVRFSDGSQGGIHAADKPEEFVAAWHSTRA